MPLKIPSSDHHLLAKFVGLSDDAAEKLISALRDCAPTLRPRDLAKRISEKAGLDLESARASIRVLIALFTTFAAQRKKITLDQFTEEVRQVLLQTGRADLVPKSGDWDVFKDRLKALLSLDKALGTTSKALDVSMQHQFWFCDSRILSEIRPVFSDDPEVLPDAAVVGHVLKLTCHKENKMRDFFIAMDSSGLRRLAETVERARKKDKTMRALLDKADVLGLQADSEAS